MGVDTQMVSMMVRESGGMTVMLEGGRVEQALLQNKSKFSCPQGADHVSSVALCTKSCFSR